MTRLRPATWVIALPILAAAGVFAAAYGSQDQQAGYDSDLPAFLKRSDSSLLTIIRHESSDRQSQHLDEYSFATANPAIYKHLAAVDKSHKLGVSANTELQPAYIEVVLSKSETKTILKEIDFEPQATQENTSYEIFVKEIEMSGRNYALQLLTPI